MAALTFAQVIETMNQRRPNAGFHIFAEYEDGARGYFTSETTLHDARTVAARLREPIIYDRNGKEVE